MKKGVFKDILVLGSIAVFMPLGIPTVCFILGRRFIKKSPKPYTLKEIREILKKTHGPKKGKKG